MKFERLQLDFMLQNNMNLASKHYFIGYKYLPEQVLQ